MSLRLLRSSPETLLAELQAAGGGTVAVIGHNPGIGTFAEMILSAPPPHGRFFDYPTGATLVADLPVDNGPKAHDASPFHTSGNRRAQIAAQNKRKHPLRQAPGQP